MIRIDDIENPDLVQLINYCDLFDTLFYFCRFIILAFFFISL